MLDGLTPVRPDFAARYRERGYCVHRPRLEDLLEREPRASAQALAEVRIDPADPALFLLGYDQSVLELVFHANAERVLGL